MSRKKCHLTYALGSLMICASLLLVTPVGAENSLTIDLSTQPHLKSWSNIIPNANRRFIVLADFNNEAVLDREMGLVWERLPAETKSEWLSLVNDPCINKNVEVGKAGGCRPSLNWPV